MVCVFDGPPEAIGICLPVPDDGTCWNDDDCLWWQSCEGEFVCTCDGDCMPSHLGACLPACEAGCCCTDEDCPEGLQCIPHEDGGICQGPPQIGECWIDKDCDPNHACVGVQMCGCYTNCDMFMDVGGECVPMTDACCVGDEDCPDNMVCTIPEQGGSCQPEPGFGECWANDDCYSIQECVGASPCPCEMDCDQASLPGACSPLPGGCCYGDSDCAQGQVCKAAYPAGDMPGSCVSHPNGPECPGDFQCCWDSGDCGGAACSGVAVCGCIELCINCGACPDFQMGACGN